MSAENPNTTQPEAERASRLAQDVEYITEEERTELFADLEERTWGKQVYEEYKLPTNLLEDEQMAEDPNLPTATKLPQSEPNLSQIDEVS